MKAPAVTVRVEVNVDPSMAFSLFTEDISRWWRRDTPYWNDRERGNQVRFEPRLGGRFLEVWDLATGEGLERGRITTWEPGRLLRFTWRQPSWPEGVETEVEVSFRPSANGTSVELTHRGFEQIGLRRFADAYHTGWQELLGFYVELVNERARP